jgi:Kef-type K+ transport system membrane component KefB
VSDNPSKLLAVVGLVLLKVITSLGSESTDLGEAIGRPLGTSFAVLLVAFLAAKFAILPLAPRIHARIPHKYDHEHNLVVIVLATIAAVAASGYAGASVLLGAYVAGLVLAALSPLLCSAEQRAKSGRPSLLDTFDRYIEPCEVYLLVPFFFASIGFAIPIKVSLAAPVWPY